MLERDFQAKLIKELKLKLPGCFILKNDSDYLGGVPDLLILFGDRWAMLEVKRTKPRNCSDYEPNQEYYIDLLDKMSYAACIYPANKEDVLNDLQHALRPRRATRVSQR